MAKAKSITELVEDLQRENESLQSLKKLFNQACRNEFGYDVKQIHTIIEKFNRYEKNGERVTATEQGKRSYEQSE